jgi:hypothetical protein
MFKIFNTLDPEQTVSYRAPNGQVRNWYHEDCNNKENLLITVGDSWTWGDHLGTIDWDTVYDDPVRLQLVYGYQLASNLNADWVLLANPGCSNYWMLEKLKSFSSRIHELKLQYKNIYVIVTLTEDLRECSYRKESCYVTDYYSLIVNSTNLQEFLEKVEKKMFLEFKSLFDTLQVDCKITRAFTDTWPDNKVHLGNYLLDKTWCDVFQDEIKFDRYYQVVPFIGQLSIGPLNEEYIAKLERQLKDTFKQDLVDLEDKLRARWNFLGYSKYNLKGSTYHPTVDGHQLFAKYLLTKFNK